MSDFGFMSSGFGDVGGDAYEENFRINITAMLSLFISKALEDSLKYIKICKRNAVTKKDLEMALKFQTLRFFQNPELENELDEMKEEIRAEMEYSENELDDAEDSDSSEGVWEDIPDGEADAEAEAGADAEAEADGETDAGMTECGEDEDEVKDIEVYSLEDGLDGILQQFTLNDEEADEFSRANLRETEVMDRNFVVDFHKCSDSWDSWEPQNDMQKTLFNAIESMTAQF
tara:strand:- start:2176 stop:2868 length:693 start_codon:yes stop_codon:yes gene_type:complete